MRSPWRRANVFLCTFHLFRRRTDDDTNRSVVGVDDRRWRGNVSNRETRQPPKLRKQKHDPTKKSSPAMTKLYDCVCSRFSAPTTPPLVRRKRVALRPPVVSVWNRSSRILCTSFGFFANGGPVVHDGKCSDPARGGGVVDGVRFASLAAILPARLYVT